MSLTKIKDERVFNKHHELVIEKITDGFFFLVLWPVFIWTLLIGKLVKSGAHDFIIHFTNWNWAMNAIFFTVRLVGRLPHIISHKESPRNMISLYANGCLFWITNGMAWLVFWLVLFMLGDNPWMLIEMATDLDLGIILDMERVFHVFPTLFLLIYWALHGDEIAWPLRVLVYRKSFDTFPSSAWAYFIFNVLFGGLLVMAIYFACFDMQSVYGIVTSISLIACVSVAIAFVLNGIMFVNLRRKYV